MKKQKEKTNNEHVDFIKKSLVNRFDINEDFVDKVYQLIETKYAPLICNDYKLITFDDNIIITHKIILTICLNFEFDKDRFDEIKLSDEYINNFVLRVVSQVLYSNLTNPTMYLSDVINHPVMLVMLSISSLIRYRTTLIDAEKLKIAKKEEFLPILILIKEAMDSLESILILIAQKNYSQAMTIYRLYLEQIILVMAIIKNPHLINKYIEHQKLAERYAKNTSDNEILKLIEEKKIPARDVKSYLSYGWIEGMKGFDELPKARYSIKIMSKLSDTSNLYELYASSTNYVHMNFLLTGVNWFKVINETIETIFATLIGIMNNYIIFANYNFIYKNMDLANELNTIFIEYEKILKKKGYDFDVIRLKTA